MQNRPAKTGTNSAYRRMKQQRQEDRRFSVVGFVAAILVITVLVFSGSSDDVPVLAPEADDVGIVPEASVHPLLQYARGVPPIEELDRQIEGSSGR